jgi:subtilisin family serine protease
MQGAEPKLATEAYLDQLHSQGKERVIVRFRDDAAVDAGVVQKHGGKLIRKFSTIKALVCEMPQASMEPLLKEGAVLSAYQDAIMRIDPGEEKRVPDEAAGPGPAFYSGSVTVRWNNLEAGVNSKAAWDRYDLDGTGVTIAFLDTGVNYNLTNLYDSYLGGEDFVEDDGDPLTTNVNEDHGTKVVSLGVGRGLSEVVGVAYRAGFYSVKVLDANGVGFASDTISAIEWASTEPHKADIISMSLGAQTLDPELLVALETACDNAYAAGITLVAASGNHGNATSDYPAAFANVISVGGHAEDQTLYNHSGNSSNGGVDIIAPGARVPTVKPDDSGWWVWGTSFAAPHAAGLLALELQYARLHNVQPNNGYLWEVMKHSAKDMPLITNLVFKGNGKIWAAETNPPPASPTDGSIDAMAKGWPLAFGLSYSNAVYYRSGHPVYCLGSNLSYRLTLTNNTSTAGNYPDDLENLDVTTTQAYYQANGETNLPGAAVEAFPRAYVPPSAMAPDTALAQADAYSIPPEVYPGTNRLMLELEFEFASDANNRLIKVSYPYAGIWSVPLERPTLHIVCTEINSVLLFWPTQAVDFTLQSIADLGTTNWVNVTNTPGIADTNYMVEVQPLAAPAFFRLAK